MTTRSRIRSRLLATVTGVGLILVALAVWVTVRPDVGTTAPGSFSRVSAARGQTMDSRSHRSAKDRAGGDGEMLSGRVLDDEGIAVTEGAVHLACTDARGSRGASARLDEEGRFALAACETGPSCVQLVHPTLVQAEPWVIERGGLSEREWMARPRQLLHGLVHDPDDQPVRGATVLVAPADGGTDRLRSRHATSDEEGVFRFSFDEAAPCDACLEAAGGCDRRQPKATEQVFTVSAQGWRTEELRLALGSGDRDFDAGTIELRAPEPPLRGTLTDPAGDAYPRAKILARSLLRSSERHSVEVDDDGQFAFHELGDGGYELRALQDGVELVRGSGHEAASDVRLVGSVEALGTRLLVRVIGPDGRAVEGARVDGGPFLGAKTDAQGRTRPMVALAPPQSMRLRAREGPKRGEAQVDTKEGDERVEVEIQLRAD